MAQTSNYERSGNFLNGVERQLDGPERILAAAQIDATRAVVDQLAILTGEVARLAAVLESLTDLPDRVSGGAELIREQIRASARS